MRYDIRSILYVILYLFFSLFTYLNFCVHFTTVSTRILLSFKYAPANNGTNTNEA